MEKIMAERSLIFIAPDGNEIISSIQFGIPYETEKHGYLCDFEIPDIVKAMSGAGIDGIQVIILSMLNAKSLLEARYDSGWRYLWADTREQTTLSEIFHGLTL